jgi:ABC-type multidrug transport system fused ATPase/permease subunit
MDISSITLPQLRSKIEIVPQNPVLFKGNLRSCLDPFHRFTDIEIHSAMTKSQLKAVLLRDRESSSSASASVLDMDLAQNGSNLSVGERQMVVLTRAILHGAKILIMDEATASMDHATDQLIQQILRQEFSKSTVLTIAHRIDTILDCDKILVMSAGEVMQFASPRELLALRSGIFYELANDGLGREVVEELVSGSKNPS